MAGMTIKPPDYMLRQFDKFKQPPDIDLDGREIKSIEEREEIDPEDNCKVHVTVYTVKSADGESESTITKRRKLKVNCMQHTKRLQFCNGKEAKLEEKTEMLTGDVDGFQHRTFERPGSFSNETNLFSNNLLSQQDDFMSLLMQKKEQLQKAYPDLFRKTPSVFDSPSSKTETYTSPDGTTFTQSSKAFRSRYTRHETYVNGVKQESKCKFRAFLEYKGPEGGFRVKLNNTTDDDLSEDENDDDELLWKRFVLPDTKLPLTGNMLTYGSSQPSTGRSRDDDCGHSAISEITDTSSALITDTGKVPKIKPQKLKRHEKAFHAVNEIVDSEARYVTKLSLLDKFRTDVDKEKILDKRQMCGLFANISSLFQFHNQHLLPQLLDRTREWQSVRRVSDVFKKQAPFLKLYSEYTNNYKNSIQIFEDMLKKKKKFADIVRMYEKMPECENLPLMSHMICPVQRVMRYQLLLKEYLKYLTPEDADYSDTEKSLELVLDAASHANEMMRRLDRYKNVLEVQELLGNSISLVSPGRELLKRAKLTKISSSSDRTEERHLFIFNDIILLASERSIALGGKFRVRAIFDAYYTQICEGDNLEREHSFYIRGCDSQNGPATRVELYADSASEKREIIDCIWSVMRDVHQSKKSFTVSFSSNSLTSPRIEKKACVKCDIEFSWFVSSNACTKCNQRYCKKCFGSRRNESKRFRICDDCGKQLNEQSLGKHHQAGSPRQDLLAVAANSEDSFKSGYLKFRGHSGRVMNRYFVLSKNLCFYSYKDQEEDCALAMLPITGCEIEEVNEKFSFSLRHMNRVYIFTASSDSERAEWMAALMLCASAQLPTESARGDG